MAYSQQDFIQGYMAKGQKISEENCGVLKYVLQEPNDFFPDFCPKGSNKINKGIFIKLISP